MEIICSSPATAYDSLANLFHCSTTALQQFIRKNWAAKYEKSHLWYETDMVEYLYFQAVKQFTVIKTFTRIHWFHGTRSLTPDSFRNGILPLQDILPDLKTSIDKVAEKYGILPAREVGKAHHHYGFLMDIKQQNDIDKGPCAMLNLEAVTNASAFKCHNYMDMPEIIEDYAHVKYGEASVQLLEFYRQEAAPMVVEFWTAPDDQYNPDIKYIVGTILFYLYAVEHPKQDMLGLHCNICYSGHGNMIDADHILKVIKV